MAGDPSRYLKNPSGGGGDYPYIFCLTPVFMQLSFLSSKHITPSSPSIYSQHYHKTSRSLASHLARTSVKKQAHDRFFVVISGCLILDAVPHRGHLVIDLSTSIVTIDPIPVARIGANQFTSQLQIRTFSEKCAESDRVEVCTAHETLYWTAKVRITVNKPDYVNESHHARHDIENDATLRITP